MSTQGTNGGPPIIPIVPKNRSGKISNSMQHFYEMEKVSEKREEQERQCAQDLLRFIRLDYPKAQLTPYGSTVSRFASRVSDIDLTLSYPGQPTEDEGKKAVLRNVEKLVRNAQATWAVEYVPLNNPIICLRWKGLSVDVSFDNSSAVANAELLRKYCNYDNRVKVLGFWIKKLTNEFDICSKQNGTIPSYGYMLMLIYYLQRTVPAVLPLDVENKENLLEKPNEQNVAQFFHGFLEFYGSDILSEKVIMIQPPKAAVKEHKDWGTSMFICDCIDETLNVTSHVYSKNRKRIQSILKRCADDMKNAIEGRLFEQEKMKKLFNRP